MKFEDYLSGKSLYGDDFSIEHIARWYAQEAEAYSDIYSEKDKENGFEYRHITTLHAYQYIQHIAHFSSVLGFGASWGFELIPLIEKIGKLFIIDSSEQTVSEQLGTIYPRYSKPNISGKIDFDDNTFDLITCFGVLHHIPNVSFVFSELCRTLSPNGYLLIREPIRSLGDWRIKRDGLTPNERGLPDRIFNDMIQKSGMKIIAKNYCHVSRGFFQKLLGKRFSSSKTYCLMDKYLSKALAGNIHYHPTCFIEKLAPSIVFYVLKK